MILIESVRNPNGPAIANCLSFLIGKVTVFFQGGENDNICLQLEGALDPIKVGPPSLSKPSELEVAPWTPTVSNWETLRKFRKGNSSWNPP